MRPHERREQSAWPFFKLAAWDARNMTWKAGKRVAETEAAARNLAAGKPGRYRVERFEEHGNQTLAPFEVA